MVRTRRQYKSGEASPPPHCLANASTTEQHNDYMLKFRAELAERRVAALAKEQEALLPCATIWLDAIVTFSRTSRPTACMSYSARSRSC